MNQTRVLLIDDDPGYTRPMRDLLERLAGHVVMEENHPEKAVATAREFRPDIILLDVSMPPTDGGAVAEALREVPALRNTPIVFLTNLNDGPPRHTPDIIYPKQHRVPKDMDANEVIRVIEEQLARVAARA